jgi:hypothetical protein
VYQKTYLDPETKQPTEIEVPLIGKLKTNYPALIFVFLGIVLAFLTFRTSHAPPKEKWEIEGIS